MSSHIQTSNIARSVVVAAVVLLWAAPSGAAQSSGESAKPAASASAKSLDLQYFKTRVAPIFLKKRLGHGRCYACHSGVESTPGRRDFIEKLPAGSSFWTDEQISRMFTRISQYVAAGNPDKSLLLMRPLALEAGGGPPGGSTHRGGRQFMSKDDPDWKILAAWAQGTKAD